MSLSLVNYYLQKAKKKMRKSNDYIGISYNISKVNGIQLFLIKNEGDLINYERCGEIPFQFINESLNSYKELFENSGIIKIQNIVGYAYDSIGREIITYLVVKRGEYLSTIEINRLKKPDDFDYICINMNTGEAKEKTLFENWLETFYDFVPMSKIEKFYKNADKNSYKKLQLAVNRSDF